MTEAEAAIGARNLRLLNERAYSIIGGDSAKNIFRADSGRTDDGRSFPNVAGARASPPQRSPPARTGRTFDPEVPTLIRRRRGLWTAIDDAIERPTGT